MKTRRVLLLGGILLVAAIIVLIVRHYQLRAATQAYIAELKAKGEPMELAQVLPPSVPPDQNSADTFRKVAVLFKADQSLLKTNSYFSCMKIVAPGKAMVCSQQPAAMGSDITNSWQEVAEAVAQNVKSYELLQTFIEKPAFDFGINYEYGVADINFTNFCLTESKQAASRLEVAALNDLHRGDSAAAAKDVRTILAIVKGMRDERLIISELVRIAIAHIALAANWEVLQSTNVTSEQLTALQNDWAAVEFFRAEENALDMERVSGQISLEKWRAPNSSLWKYLNAWRELGYDQSEQTAIDRLKMRYRLFCWRHWWSYSDELRALKGYQILLEAPRAALTNLSLLTIEKNVDSEVDQLSIPTNSAEFWVSDPKEADMHSMLSGSVLTLSRVFNRIIRIEAGKRMTIVALALRTYQLKHGAYPSSLNALIPDFLHEVPHDPIDGQPLRYHLNTNGTFLLYSIGDDGKDDGGDPTPVSSSNAGLWYSGRDWVWPQPATPEEIQNYYKNPPK